MAGFGDVLRGLGSVLNPSVNQDVEGEYQKRIAQQQQMQQFALGQLVKGVESGAISPDSLPAPLRGIVGVSPEAQKRMEALKRESEMRTRLAAAQTPEARRAIAMEYASPDALARMPVDEKRLSVAPGNNVIDGKGQVIYTAPDKPEKPNYKERNISYDGKTYVTETSTDAGQTWARVPGSAPVDIKSAKGASTITNTVGMPLGKEASNKIDTGLLDTTKGLMTLSAIESQFKPQYQQFVPRISAEWSGIREKLGANLNPTDKAFLTDFSSYKRNAINAMNEYIKSITGAAMSEQEAQRILKGMPSPGQGLLDGDSPTEFKAKLDDAMRQTKMALARYEYIKRNGIALTDNNGNAVIGLDKMPQIMNDRGKQIEEQLKSSNPNATKQQVEGKVRDVLAKEFGLVR